MTLTTELQRRMPRGLPRKVRAMAVVGSVVALAGLSLARQAGTRSWRTVWAEDGVVFFHDSAARGIRSFAGTYSGYLVTVPRILAFAGGLLPARDASAWYAVTASLVTALLALTFYWFSDFLIASKTLRGVLAASFVLHPLVADELLNNVSNTIWAFTLLCFVALLRPPRSRLDTVVASTITFFAALSQVLCVVWLPIAGLALWRRPRDARTRFVVGSYICALIVQAAAMIGASNTAARASTHLDELPEIFVVRVLGSGLIGERWVRDAWLAGGYLVAALAAIVVLTIVVLLARRTPTSTLSDAAIVIGASLVFFAVSVGYRGTSLIALHSGAWTSALSRFVFVSLELLLLGVFVLIDRARMQAATRQVIIMFVALQLAVVGIASFSYTNGRSSGPVWADSVTAASVQCARAPQPRDAVIAISPPPFWATTVSCTWLLEHS